jgi:hypothetical protein
LDGDGAGLIEGKMPTGFYILMTALGVFCLASIGMSLAAIVCGARRRFLPAFILCFLALVIALVGWTRFSFNWSETVNGVVTWRLDSKWLFEASLVVGTLALGFVICRKVKFNRVLKADAL